MASACLSRTREQIDRLRLNEIVDANSMVGGRFRSPMPRDRDGRKSLYSEPGRIRLSLEYPGSLGSMETIGAPPPMNVHAHGVLT